MAVISIIIPVFDVEKYINECIDSVLAQTFSDFELILVDDGSPDNCPDICDAYSVEDSRIRVIHQENGGLSSARNAGLDIARGDYILFVDSDDYISPNMLQEMYLTQTKTGADMVVPSVCAVTEKGKTIKKELCRIDCVAAEEYMRNIYNSQYSIYTVSWGKLYNASVFKDIRFPKGKIHEDEFVAHHIIDKCKTIASANEAEYFYRQRSNSIMGKKYSIRNLDGIEALIERANFLSSNGYPKDLVNETLHMIMKMLHRSYECAGDKYKEYLWRYKELYPQYKKIARKCLKNKMSMPKKCGIVISLVNPKLTYTVRNINRLRLKQQYYKKHIAKIEHKCRKYKKRVFMLYTPLYCNLGDQAIRIGKELYLKKYFYEYKNIEIDEEEMFSGFEEKIKKLIKKDDVIILPGGGFIGDLWTDVNDDLKKIIADYAENKIIIMPQTSFYGDEENKIKDEKFYRNHKNVYMCFRDRASYDGWSKAIGKDRCGYFPDMAMMVDYKPHTRKKDILLCFRKDHEKVQSNEQIENLENIINGLNKKFSYTDTVIEELPEFRAEQAIRDKAVKDKLDEFAGAELIITNRLHGMVMSAIAGTPCIALDNLSKKVSGVYEWIKYLDYIKIATIEEINADMIKEMMSKKNCVFDRKPIEKDFERLSEKIKAMLS